MTLHEIFDIDFTSQTLHAANFQFQEEELQLYTWTLTERIKKGANHTDMSLKEDI